MALINSIKKIDNEGRIVIPAEIRYLLNIKENDIVQFLLENNRLVIKILPNLEKSKKQLNIYLKHFCLCYKTSTLILDKYNRVIALFGNFNIPKKFQISKQLKDIINQNTTYFKETSDIISLFDYDLLIVNIVIPIVINNIRTATFISIDNHEKYDMQKFKLAAIMVSNICKEAIQNESFI